MHIGRAWAAEQAAHYRTAAMSGKPEEQQGMAWLAAGFMAVELTLGRILEADDGPE